MTITTAKWTIDEYHQMVDAGILRESWYSRILGCQSKKITFGGVSRTFR